MLPEPERAPEKPAEPGAIASTRGRPCDRGARATRAAAVKAAPAQPVKGVLQAPPAPNKKGGLFGWLFHKRVRGGSGQ